MSDRAKFIFGLVGILFSLALLFYIFSPAGIISINEWEHSLQEADDSSNYQTKKKVEDTCRSMIASYNSDQLTYEQYKDSENEEKQSWAEQARMRANKTAVSYNEYILKNRYVWKENIPADICYNLPLIE